MTHQSKISIGIDLGGTKISAIAMSSGQTLKHFRIAAPKGDYQKTLEALAKVITDLEAEFGKSSNIGIGMPGSISPITDKVQNANSTWLNGKTLHLDLRKKLNRDIIFANDANCFALSEATDGAGKGAKSVFGVIIGTGLWWRIDLEW